MSRKPNLALVGATGAVGTVMIDIINNRENTISFFTTHPPRILTKARLNVIKTNIAASAPIASKASITLLLNSGRETYRLTATSAASNERNPSGKQRTKVHHKLGKLMVYLADFQCPLWVGSCRTNRLSFRNLSVAFRPEADI